MKFYDKIWLFTKNTIKTYMIISNFTRNIGRYLSSYQFGMRNKEHWSAHPICLNPTSCICSYNVLSSKSLSWRAHATIEKIIDAQETIPPTSVESERAFSAAGLFITKLRTRLSVKNIDALCFLRNYYKKNNCSNHRCF